MAPVALNVQIAQVGDIGETVVEVLFLISFPRIETEKLGVQNEACRSAKVELRLRLDAETAAHIVVTLNHIEIVTLRTTEHNTTHKDALFHF